MDATSILAWLPAVVRENHHAELAVIFERELRAIAEVWGAGPRPDDAFARYVGERIGRHADGLASKLDRLRIADLYLAWWAQVTPDTGVPVLWKTMAPDLERVVGRFPKLERDELAQQLRVHLFVAPADGIPTIAKYDGFGFFSNWMRVVASRLFLDAVRRARQTSTTSIEDEPLLELLAPTRQLGLGHDKVHAAIRAAFADAVDRLAPRARAILRLATVDGVTLDKLAAMYGIGRATVARTLAASRAHLRDLTRTGMLARLEIPASDLDSLIRELDSQLDLSLVRVLGDPGD